MFRYLPLLFVSFDKHITMKIGLDLDGTITRYPEFFSKLTYLWDDEVYIITFRPGHRERDEQELDKLGITYTDIIYANKDDDSKAKAIAELGVEVFWDDMPEFLVHVDKSVACFLVRGEHNFDPKNKQFLFTRYTGKLQQN